MDEHHRLADAAAAWTSRLPSLPGNPGREAPGKLSPASKPWLAAATVWLPPPGMLAGEGWPLFWLAGTLLLGMRLHAAAAAPRPSPRIVALIGVDEDPGGPAFPGLRLRDIRRRSDSLVLVAAANRGRARALWLPRDTWVTLPSGRRDILGHALRRGGIGCLDRVVEGNFGLRVSGHVAVDFAGFSRLVDAVGGIRLQDGGRADGARVLELVRERRGDPRGDIGRIGRQMEIGRRIAAAARQVGPVGVLHIALTLPAAIRSDLDPRSAAALAWRIADGGLEAAMLPGSVQGQRYRADPDAPGFARRFLGMMPSAGSEPRQNGGWDIALPSSG